MTIKTIKEQAKLFGINVVGTQLLCIDTYSIFCDITIGEKYDLIKQDDEDYTLINDKGTETFYSKQLFKIIKQ